MIASGKFENHVTTCVASRQTNRRHGRLGPGVHHAHHLNGGKGLDDQLRQADLTFCRRPKAASVCGGLLYCCDDLRMRMAEDQGPPGTNVVQVDVAIHIIKPCSGGTLDERRLQVDRFEGPYRAVHTARDELLRLLK